MLLRMLFAYLERKMNEYDRENLEFLLNADEETLADWYDTVDVDDHEYASELLAQYSEELAIKSSIYNVEEMVTKLTPDADECIRKFTLGKKQ